jgi:hypothetical protein
MFFPKSGTTSLLGGFLKNHLVPKRKVFISYHHRNDQDWFDHFTGKFSEQYEIFFDQSLDGQIRSDDTEYVNRRIREDFIVGSSITIVLCGTETWKRKYVDWEIYSTLHHEHALLGIALPRHFKRDGLIIVPDRLHDNIVSGYARWIMWQDNAAILKQEIETAISHSQNNLLFKPLLRNDREKMGRNLS